jgi:negative regulator of flagellin synthesis FlgM
VTNRINGYENTQSLPPSKGASGGVQGTDKPQSDAPVVPTGSAGSAASSTSDQVTLTDSARTLQKLGDAIATSPVVNSAKVATVRAAIQSGTYQINSQSVADKLLQYESGLN